MGAKESANIADESFVYPTPEGREVKAEPCTFVILGATGDLAQRKLMPALYHLIEREKMLPPETSIVGCAGSERSDDQFREMMRKALTEYSRQKPTKDELDRFLARLHYRSTNFEDPDAYKKLAAFLDKLEKKEGIPRHHIFYLAIPPSLFATTIEQLAAAGLTRREKDQWPRVVIEKPFGRDLASAIELNDTVLTHFPEACVYRIDHYLGKETVQNIMVLRFANGQFEPTWNRRYVDHVQITVAEDRGIGDRGRYYEEAGVIRDMVQNHILQLMAMVAMEPPTSFDAEAIRDEKVKVLRSIRPIEATDVRDNVVRAQYGRGFLGGGEVKAYREEEHVDPDSTTETYVAIKLFIENWRWANVPFYIRSGKYLAKRVSEVAIQYRAVPHLLFRQVLPQPLEPSSLILRIQPDEGVSLKFATKHPGMLMDVRTQSMDFRYYTAYGDQAPEAYERLLLDVVLGDSTLFPRTDGVIESWKFVDRIVEGWELSRERQIPTYDPGSWGPLESIEMMAADRRKWRRP
ncbi:glucose-6-phosphate dehydrogenase [bacterium]|nr:glucose-6-phosphate dehydrogenase [bacterium]